MHIHNESQFWNEMVQTLKRINGALDDINNALEKICPEVKSTEPNKMDLLEDDGK